MGQFLEGLFGRPQDIEFVMKKDRLAEIVVAGEKILTDAMLQQGEHRFGRLSKLFPLRRMGYMIRVSELRGLKVRVEIPDSTL